LSYCLAFVYDDSLGRTQAMGTSIMLVWLTTSVQQSEMHEPSFIVPRGG